MNLFDDLRMRESAGPYERLARKGLAAYGLEDAKVVPVKADDHVVLRITEAGVSYALHIHPRGWDRSKIERSLLWQTSLCRAAVVRCPEPVLTLSGDLVQNLSTPGISGFRYVVLESWIDAAPVSLAEWTPALAERAGVLLGRLHTHGASFTLPPELAAKVPTHEDVRARFNPHELAKSVSDADESVLSRALDCVCEALSAGTAADAIGLIHGALLPTKLLLGEREEALIGFHCTSEGHSAYDLATLDLALRSLEQADALRKGLLEGYATSGPPGTFESPLNPFALWRLLDEIAALPPDASPGRGRRLSESLRDLVEAC